MTRIALLMAPLIAPMIATILVATAAAAQKPAAPAQAAAQTPGQTPAQALQALRAAATAGDPDAQFRLAQTYQLGKGTGTDAETAIMWYRRAAAQGHAQASDELGFLLFSHGDRKLAMPYVEKAAARGDPRAFYLLGIAHFNGDLAPRDWPLAYAQMTRAAEGGLPAGKANLQMMDKYLLPPDLAKANVVLATLPPARRVIGNATAGATAAAAPAPTAPPPVATAAASPARAEPPRSGGKWRVQFGAFGARGPAESAWDVLVRKLPVLQSVDRRIVTVGPIVRLQGWNIASRGDAQALCGRVRAAGGGCLVLAPEA